MDKSPIWLPVLIDANLRIIGGDDRDGPIADWPLWAIESPKQTFTSDSVAAALDPSEIFAGESAMAELGRGCVKTLVGLES